MSVTIITKYYCFTVDGKTVDHTALGMMVTSIVGLVSGLYPRHSRKDHIPVIMVLSQDHCQCIPACPVQNKTDLLFKRNQFWHKLPAYSVHPKSPIKHMCTETSLISVKFEFSQIGSQLFSIIQLSNCSVQVVGEGCQQWLAPVRRTSVGAPMSSPPQ